MTREICCRAVEVVCRIIKNKGSCDNHGLRDRDLPLFAAQMLQVQGSLLPECQPPPWAWLAAVWAMGGRKCLAHSIFVLISGKDYESSLKINSPPLDGDGELGLARPGSPGPFYSQGKDQPYQTESTKSSGSFYLGKPWESVYQKKKKKPCRENFSKTLWHPLGEGYSNEKSSYSLGIGFRS